MALAKKDYDAQAAEEAFTRFRSQLQGGAPPVVGESTGALLACLAYAAIAQAHALEEIAKAAKEVADHFASKNDGGYTAPPTPTGKKH